MADRFRTPVRPLSSGKQEDGGKLGQVFNLPAKAQSKSDVWWPRNLPKWFRDNLRWIVALVVSVLAACLFFTITNNDPFEDFMELVLALAVGGTISAAASFRVTGEGRAKRKSGEI